MLGNHAIALVLETAHHIEIVKWSDGSATVYYAMEAGDALKSFDVSAWKVNKIKKDFPKLAAKL